MTITVRPTRAHRSPCAGRSSPPAEDTGDHCGRVSSQALPPEEENSKRERSLALLRSVADIGEEAEQQETFTYLQSAIDEDRLSDRKRFA